MHSLCVCMLCLNHRDELDRSTLDLDSRQKRQINVSVTETNSTVQRMNVCVLYIALASFIYTRDYVAKPKECVKFDQPYLSEEVTRSF